MLKYLFRRSLAILPVLWGISTIVFILNFVLPGDPARMLLGQHGDPEIVESIRHQLGLDRPLYKQYLAYYGRLLQGNLGTSYRQHRPVREIISERFPATFKLTVAATLLAILFGMGAGIMAAMYHNRWLDTGIMILSLFGISIPIFWLGLMLILLFSSGLGWLPAGGFGENGDLAHLFLPALSLSAVSMGYIARITRSSMLDVVRQDYIRTAQAKGLHPAVIVLKHALKNALIPVITVVGLNFAGLMCGSIATEIIFAWPGLGKAIFEAISMRDRPVILGGVLFFAFVFVLVNALVDAFYSWVDPRIQLEGEGAA